MAPINSIYDYSDHYGMTEVHPVVKVWSPCDPEFGVVTTDADGERG